MFSRGFRSRLGWRESWTSCVPGNVASCRRARKRYGSGDNAVRLAPSPISSQYYITEVMIIGLRKKSWRRCRRLRFPARPPGFLRPTVRRGGLSLKAGDESEGDE